MENICSNENETIKIEDKFRQYLKSTEKGDSDGQLNLRYCYEEGIGTIKDEGKAFQWGNHGGQNNLGNCYRNGIGTVKDEGKAFHWYLKSAEGENHGGQYNLGYCYQNGIGTIKDKEKAFQWYLKSAEGGNHGGQNKLGTCYQDGIGTIKDEEKAFQWYLKSAEGGSSNGQNNLGTCYRYGIGTIKDERKAFRWYLKSAEGGSSNGQLNLGVFYGIGIGTIKDEGKAFQWYLKSAEGGNHGGQSNLGNCYLNGIGTIKNEGKAFQWYLKSAEGGNQWGQNNLGNCYRNGIGTVKDDGKAFHWYLKSAEGGNHGGQYNLGYCYQNGIGTIKDEGKAFQWFLKSAEGGEKFGQSVVEYLYRNEISYVKKNRNSLEHQCISCENLIQLNNTCSDCKLKEKPKWTSEYLAEGGFGSIWKAEWIDMPEELTANFQCRDKYVLPILGITQDSMTKEYAIVLRYMKNGNLRDFLDQNKSLPWIERLWLLNSFIRGLKVIHSKGFIRRDLHPGNLMITEAYNISKYKFIRLGDLGLCRLANETSSSGAYGVLPYIAPEVLNKYQYSQASDIYSVGIIMWVISTGKRPFANSAYDAELATDIFNGLRPKINKYAPQCYIELMEMCWHKDLSERPFVEIIYDRSEKWIKDLLYDKKSTDSLMFLNAEQKMQDEYEDEDSSSVEITHSKAYITSKPLPSVDFNMDNLAARLKLFG
ncbi:hypothetical protein Glove_325g31 [Diversispora epigaea]|uniref:Protein kinase domain-containing protein n=1 Tax=Diversispora epigaea TaxID=1348612 RepID=A0A397HML5_9GLOM|nr:hypothetical protein Glove_325g31 [Diversispora epigaea]